MANMVVARFADGQLLKGRSRRPKLPFFFLVPVDADSNNVRILINGDQLAGMQLVDAPAP